ncbi:hypothetical protein QF000_006390 [Paraburkholderia atlantica]
MRPWTAPVKLPFSWPNSSASISSSGIAPQFTATNAPSLRPLRSWMVRAISSLPVPDSPMISAVASVSATRSICSYRSSITGDEPYSSPYDFSPATASPTRCFDCGEALPPADTVGESRSIDAIKGGVLCK